MGKAALILTTIFGFINVIWAGVLCILSLNANALGLGFFYLACVILSGVFTIIAINSIVKNNKKIWIGVCDLLFCGVIGGIFYLIWNPYDANPTEAVVKQKNLLALSKTKSKQKKSPPPKKTPLRNCSN